MNLIERYIFRRMSRAFLLCLIALAATVWLTQALRQFDLVSAMGQTIVTFFQITVLLLPPLAIIVSPVALLLAVTYTFSSLNDGSELVVINASGARQSTMLKPVLLIGVLTSVFVATMTLYFSPLSLRLWRELVTEVRGDVLTSILREGEFMKLGDGLIFQLRNRLPDGTLRGIFLSDTREKELTVTYLAQRGAVLDSPLGMFLVMNDGTIQRRNRDGKSISIIEFTSYAFDLSTFSSRTSVRAYRPAERDTPYLFNPDPNDKIFRQFPGKFRSELHSRMTAPLFALVFAVLPAVFMSQAESTRRRRTATLALLIGSAAFFGVSQFVLTGYAETSLIAVVAMYVLPLTAIVGGSALVLLGIQARPPERLVAFGDFIASVLSGLLRTAAPSPAGRSS